MYAFLPRFGGGALRMRALDGGAGAAGAAAAVASAALHTA